MKHYSSFSDENLTTQRKPNPCFGTLTRKPMQTQAQTLTTLTQPPCDCFPLLSFCRPEERIPAVFTFRMMSLSGVHCISIHHWRCYHAVLPFWTKPIIKEIKYLKISLLILFVVKFALLVRNYGTRLFRYIKRNREIGMSGQWIF